MSNRYVAIDRLALLLPSRIYDIYTESHHPHEPAFANLNEAVKPSQLRKQGSFKPKFKLSVNTRTDLRSYAKGGCQGSVRRL